MIQISEEEKYLNLDSIKCSNECNKKSRYAKISSGLLRDAAVEEVGRGFLGCVNCGCRLTLEINHKNHDGKNERETSKFYQSIVNKTRSIDDLDLRCKLCNWAYSIEYWHGLDYEIIFKGKKY